MGKYAMTRARRNYDRASSSNNQVTGLNNDGWNRAMYHLSDIGIFGFQPIKWYYQDKYMDDYLRNRGLDWSSMLYPGIAKGSGAGMGKWSVDYKSVKKLYR